MKYTVILTLGTITVCAYLLFLVSPRYDLGELRAENRELRERIVSLERSQGISEIQTVILIGGGIAVCLCLLVCHIMYTECSLRKTERMTALKFQEMQAYRLLFQNQAMQAVIPKQETQEITYQEMAYDRF